MSAPRDPSAEVEQRDQRPQYCPRDHTCRSRYNSHDTRAAYQAGCRSGAALADWLLYRNCRAAGVTPPGQRHIPSLGTRRRLQGLHRQGYSWVRLCRELDWPTSRDPDRLGCIARARESTHTIDRRYAQAVADMTRRLCEHRGPDTRATRNAERCGWHPLGAWDDIDDPHETPKYDGPRFVGLRRQLDDEVARLTEAGMTAAHIAERLNITERTVVRIRGRVRDDEHDAGEAA